MPNRAWCSHLRFCSSSKSRLDISHEPQKRLWNTLRSSKDRFKKKAAWVNVEARQRSSKWIGKGIGSCKIHPKIPKDQIFSGHDSPVWTLWFRVKKTSPKMPFNRRSIWVVSAITCAITKGGPCLAVVLELTAVGLATAPDLNELEGTMLIVCYLHDNYMCHGHVTWITMGMVIPPSSGIPGTV